MWSAGRRHDCAEFLKDFCVWATVDQDLVTFLRAKEERIALANVQHVELHFSRATAQGLENAEVQEQQGDNENQKRTLHGRPQFGTSF
jgi:hypothetical protein